MKKIDEWMNAPDWVEWKATDKNGDLFYYETKPYLHSEESEWVSLHGVMFVGTFEPPHDYKETLQNRRQLEIPYDHT